MEGNDSDSKPHRARLVKNVGQSLDLIIKGGLIVDGTGLPPYRADVGIRGRRIAAIGSFRHTHASQIVDATGSFVCPGWIDVHTHSDLMAAVGASYEEKLRQGVTSEIVGNCGISVAPVSTESLKILSDAFLKLLGFDSPAEVEWRWGSYGEYLGVIQETAPTLNIGGLVGHAALRAEVMGAAARPAERHERLEMCRLLDLALAEGALGLSSGVYLSAGAADIEEMAALAHVAAEHGRVFCYHMPNYAAGLTQSGRFAVEIGSRSGAAVHISHIKASGPRNWPLLEDFLAIIREGREQGVKITGDVYPYAAGASAAWSMFPPEAIDGGIDALIRRIQDPEWRARIRESFRTAGGATWFNVAKEIGWDNAYIASVHTRRNRQWEGKSISELSEVMARPPADAMMDLILDEQGQVTYLAFDGNEDQVETVLSDPGIMIGSDGLYGGRIHPRLFGTFPRILSEYVRRRRVMSWEEAIRRMSSLPAITMGISERGYIHPGMLADIVLFDPESVKDTATYEKPDSFPEGIGTVIVNGSVAIQGGDYQPAKAGCVLYAERGIA